MRDMEKDQKLSEMLGIKKEDKLQEQDHFQPRDIQAKVAS